MPAKKRHDFDKMAAQALSEMEADVPRLNRGLDLTADAGVAGEDEMVRQVQEKWSDPQYKHDLIQRESSEHVIELLLRANGVMNGDGTPMSVHTYQKTVLEPFMANGTSPFIPVKPPPMLSAPMPAPGPPPAAGPPPGVPAQAGMAPPSPTPTILGPDGQPLAPSQPTAPAPLDPMAGAPPQPPLGGLQ